jgi:hypothetical protein
MKESKIQKLFEAARKEAAPEVNFTFSQSVISAIRRDARQPQTSSLFDQLGALFPRLALASVIIIGLCIATEFYFSSSAQTTSAEVTQAAEEWLYASN